MSCGCRPVAELRAEDRSEVTSVSRKRGQGRTPRWGRVIDALFFSRITFSFFEATAVHCASDASVHDRSFAAHLTREALRAERRAAAERVVQGVLKVAFRSFLDQLPPRLPPRPSTNPTFTSFLTQTPTMLTEELLQLPDAPSLLAQRCKLWRELPEHHHLRYVTVCGLRVVCIPTILYLHCQNKPKNS